MSADPSFLPPGYAARPPTPDDLGGVLDLLTAHDIAEFGEQDWGEADLRDDWAGIDLATEAWIVVAPTGEVAGYATLTHRGGYVRLDADGYVHPAHTGRGIGTHLVRWAEARALTLLPLAPAGAQVLLSTGINGRNPDARALLERLSYAPARHFYRMAIDLDEAPPPPVWPPGITVRDVASAEDERTLFAAVDEAFRDHWDFTPVTFEEWARRHKGENFDPRLWFLALDGAEVAGGLTGRYQLDAGWVNHLAVRPAWRRRGLGLALLRHAFGEFFRRGRRSVGLGVDATSETGATRLYERAGMRVIHEYALYRKELRPGREAEAR